MEKSETSYVETVCMHCGISDKHTTVGTSTCPTEWSDGEDGPPESIEGHDFLCLECKTCKLITVWHGFVPGYTHGEEYESDDDLKTAFNRYFKCLYPEVTFTRAWKYTIPKKSMGSKIVFFLDQAEKAAAIGLHNASAASFRSALEAVVDADGTTPGITSKGKPIMLGARIKALTSKVPLPDWVKHLDEPTLTFFKDLGNDAVHIDKLHAYTQEMTDALRSSMDIILQEFYRDTKKSFAAASQQLSLAKSKAVKV